MASPTGRRTGQSPCHEGDVDGALGARNGMPILPGGQPARWTGSALSHGRMEQAKIRPGPTRQRSEEHTSELQSLAYLVCRLLLEKKNTISFFYMVSDL